MGGSSSVEVKKPTELEQNNNKNDVVVIPVDQSANAERAFKCKLIFKINRV